jgi:hypothetical protein
MKIHKKVEVYYERLLKLTNSLQTFITDIICTPNHKNVECSYGISNSYKTKHVLYQLSSHKPYCGNLPKKKGGHIHNQGTQKDNLLEKDYT